MNHQPATTQRQTRSTAKRILIANSKGGCGKSTLTTNLASLYARRNQAPAVLDYDPQGSSSQWLSNRDKHLPPILGIKAFKTAEAGVTRDWFMRVPRHIQRIIVDTPAALSGPELNEQIRLADLILVPVLPSPIDSHAAARFIGQILLSGNFRGTGKSLLVLANRVKEHTKSLQKLDKFLASLKLPRVGQLRDTQNYVYCAEIGIGIADMNASKSDKDRHQWQVLINCIEQQLTSKIPAPTSSATAQNSEAVYTIP
jgi:chromosome partitioning protein